MEGRIRIYDEWVNPGNLQDFVAEFPGNEEIKELGVFLQHWWNDDETILFHTSGSTGQPREIHLRKTAMIRSAEITNAFFGLDANTNLLLCLPVKFIAGAMMVVRALVAGGNIKIVKVNADPFHSDLFPPADFMACTPLQLQRGLATGTGKRNIESVTNIIVGGGEVSAGLAEKLCGFSNSIFSTYAMTETITHIALRRLSGANISPVFTVLPGFHTEVDDRGCLVINAPHLEGKVVTNDLVELEGDKFRWIGRTDFVINSGGLKISPEDWENKLEAIIPVPFIISSVADDVSGEKPVIVLESESISENEKTEMLRVLAQVLPGPVRIRGVYTLTRLPQTENGKINRPEIRKLIRG